MNKQLLSTTNTKKCFWIISNIVNFLIILLSEDNEQRSSKKTCQTGKSYVILTLLIHHKGNNSPLVYQCHSCSSSGRQQVYQRYNSNRQQRMYQHQNSLPKNTCLFAKFSIFFHKCWTLGIVYLKLKVIQH